MRLGWLAGFVLDEAALFGESAAGAAVNAEEILQAAETRLLPGGQGWVISSPYGPTGILYDLYCKHWGKPGHTLVVRAPTRAMNPMFPQEQIDKIRAEKPDVASREYDAEWVDADSAFFRRRPRGQGCPKNRADCPAGRLSVPGRYGCRYKRQCLDIGYLS